MQVQIDKLVVQNMNVLRWEVVEVLEQLVLLEKAQFGGLRKLNGLWLGKFRLVHTVLVAH